MNYRKLISFGKGGFVISVPKSWINENNLAKGAIITLEQKENTIILSAQSEFLSKSEATQISIMMDGLSPEAVISKMTNAYLNSTTLITLTGKELPKMLSTIKSHVHNSIALEIIDSEKHKLVVKDYLNFSDVSINGVFRKMDMVVRSIFADIKNTADPASILIRLNEINRHFLLLIKSIKKASSDHSMLKTFGVRSAELFTYWDNGLALKRIGAELERFIILQKKATLKPAISEDLTKLISMNERFYLTIVKSLFKGDKPDTIYTDQQEIYAAIEEFQNKHLDEKHAPVLAEILRCITCMCEDIVRGMG